MSIDTVLRAEAEHHVRVAPSDRHDNLSTFECSCGQMFFPDAVGTTPNDAPTMPSAHRAAKTLAALGLPVGVRAHGPDDLEDAEPGTVIGFQGVMMQRKREGHWFAQDGTRRETNEITGRVLVMWALGRSVGSRS